MVFNSIGLEVEVTKELAKDLNVLLSNFQGYYQNLRGIHWNIKGKRFFDLHVKFEELYTDANMKVDEIAERILTLGETPLHTFEDYMKEVKVPIGKNIKQDVQIKIKMEFLINLIIVLKYLDLLTTEVVHGRIQIKMA